MQEHQVESMPQATPSAILVQYILKQIKIGAFVATQD
jgi:hypothetical protein